MVQAEHVGVTIHIEVTDGDPIVTPSAVFEAGEHGVTIGLRVIPWHRVLRYWWELAQTDADDDGRPGPTVRVELDDGTGHAERRVVDADRFEVSAWTISFLDRDRVEPERGAAIFRKIHVPWALVREFERIRVDGPGGSITSEPPVGRLPARPDALG